ncbi:hypothetical protein GCM10010174_06370 [Kutzneria viridogrisea]
MCAEIKRHAWDASLADTVRAAHDSGAGRELVGAWCITKPQQRERQPPVHGGQRQAADEQASSHPSGRRGLRTAEH